MSERTVVTPGASRPRRLRRNVILRDMVAETTVRAEQLIMPHFVLPADKGEEPIPSMPGISRYGCQNLLKRVGADLKLGIRTVLLFGLAEEGVKDPTGKNAADPKGTVPTAVAALKKEFGHSLNVVTDVCLCAYTDHGHCGVIKGDDVDNDSSLVPLTEMALAHARAGADVVAPSDMMDGRVGAIRNALDEEELKNVAILSYSTKYASAYYGPFRDAADSAPGKGDRKGYQMDYRNSRDALREAMLDEIEGADMLMVKPALAYLDVIRMVRDHTDLPLAAYNVSGEFSQVKAAAEKGWVDEALIVRENLTAIKRAGADIIITYHAREALEGKWL